MQSVLKIQIKQDLVTVVVKNPMPKCCNTWQILYQVTSCYKTQNCTGQKHNDKMNRCCVMLLLSMRRLFYLAAFEPGAS